MTGGTQLSVAEPTRLDRLRGPLLMGALAVGLTLSLHYRDPHSSGSWGFCPWLVLTGHSCPGCGSLRAMNDLTNGDVVGALSSNLLFVLMLGLAAANRWRLTPALERAIEDGAPPPGALVAALALETLLKCVAAIHPVMRPQP